MKKLLRKVVKLFRAKNREIFQEGDDQKTVFEKIYLSNRWGSDESRSGPGSEAETTINIRREIPILWRDLNIKSVLDAPCGDFNWMKLMDLQGIDYLGVDIVEPLIQENLKKYAATNIRFQVKNLVSDPLPTVDLIVCKDCLFHLSNQDVLNAIDNFKKSGSTYLLTTHHLGRSFECNTDITAGSYRRINLELPPFNFPSPQRVILEANHKNPKKADRTLSLWKIASL